MIYALEWHNLKRTKYSDLIEYHPNLTAGDQQRLTDLNIEHSISSGVTLFLTSIIANRTLANTDSLRFMKQRWLRTPAALLVGGVFTLAVN